MKKTSLKAIALTSALSFMAGTLLSVTDTIGALNLRGDVNGDGIINVLDFIELKSILLGEDTGRTDDNKKEDLSASSTVDVDILLSDPEYFPDTPDREQLITSVSEYETYLKEIHINEALSSVLLRNPPDFENNVIFYITRKTKNHIFSLKSGTIDSHIVDITLSAKEGPSAEHLITVTVPRSIYKNQSLKCTKTSDIESDYTVFEPEEHRVYKPVIYLYPEETTDINVKLDIDGEFVCTYPEYPENGWNVTAEPDSVLHDENGNEYSYLFWEGNSDYDWDMSEGFVVKGEDTVAFLKEKLTYLGLTPKEYNDFIVFWLPKMQNNKYNLISFQTDLYEQYAKLDITPEPDCIQRVFMAYKPLDEYCEAAEQKLEPFTRHGYSVIEWGGTEVK